VVGLTPRYSFQELETMLKEPTDMDDLFKGEIVVATVPALLLLIE